MSRLFRVCCVQCLVSRLLCLVSYKLSLVLYYLFLVSHYLFLVSYSLFLVSRYFRSQLGPDLDTWPGRLPPTSLGGMMIVLRG